MTTFLKATLVGGEQVVAEFSKLKGSGESYATRVLAGVQVFNAWRVVGTTHPVSGESVLLRQRRMIAGKQITEIVPVVPIAGREQDHGLDPSAFEARVEMQTPEFGLYTVPATDGPEGVAPGTVFPIRRDASTLERYVVLRVAEGDAPERRFTIDTPREVSHGTVDDLVGSATAPERADGPSDGDDDLSAADYDE